MAASSRLSISRSSSLQQQMLLERLSYPFICIEHELHVCSTEHEGSESQRWAPESAFLRVSSTPGIPVLFKDGTAPALHQLLRHAPIGSCLVGQLVQEHDYIAQPALLQLILPVLPDEGNSCQSNSRQIKNCRYLLACCQEALTLGKTSVKYSVQYQNGA